MAVPEQQQQREGGGEAWKAPEQLLQFGKGVWRGVGDDEQRQRESEHHVGERFHARGIAAAPAEAGLALERMKIAHSPAHDYALAEPAR